MSEASKKNSIKRYIRHYPSFFQGVYTEFTGDKPLPKVLQSRPTIFIFGEQGVGKTILARHLFGSDYLLLRRQEVLDAFSLLSNNDALNFIGNVEGLEIPRGTADVIVCEGFMGNVVLKLLEGITELAADLAKEAYESKLIWKLGLTMLSKELRKLRRLTDWKQYGGAPILGFDKVVIKAHGRSNALAIRNAIKLAAKVHEGDLVCRIQEKMEQ